MQRAKPKRFSKPFRFYIENMKYTANSSDADLLTGCRNKHRLAQKYLYQRYYGRMLGIPMRYTKHREEAIEVLNQAFLKVFTNIDKYKPIGALSGWIATIVLRASIDYVRKHTKYKQVMDYNSEKEVGFYSQVLDELAVEDLYKTIQKLPKATQSVFSLHAIDGYKHREIAELLGISVGTSKWHLSEAKKQLRVLLKNYDRVNASLDC